MILLAVIFSSLYCWGIWIASSEDMILYPVRKFSDKYFPSFIHKPFMGCIVCFASVHGGPVFYLLTGNLVMLIPGIVVIAGLNYLMGRYLA